MAEASSSFWRSWTNSTTTRDKGLNVIQHGFTMDPFLAGQMEAASAMTYSDQVALESGLSRII